MPHPHPDPQPLPSPRGQHLAAVLPSPGPCGPAGASMGWRQLGRPQTLRPPRAPRVGPAGGALLGQLSVGLGCSRGGARPGGHQGKWAGTTEPWGHVPEQLHGLRPVASRTAHSLKTKLEAAGQVQPDLHPEGEQGFYKLSTFRHQESAHNRPNLWKGDFLSHTEPTSPQHQRLELHGSCPPLRLSTHSLGGLPVTRDACLSLRTSRFIRKAAHLWGHPPIARAVHPSRRTSAHGPCGPTRLSPPHHLLSLGQLDPSLLGTAGDTEAQRACWVPQGSTALGLELRRQPSARALLCPSAALAQSIHASGHQGRSPGPSPEMGGRKPMSLRGGRRSWGPGVCPALTLANGPLGQLSTPTQP